MGLVDMHGAGCDQEVFAAFLDAKGIPQPAELQAAAQRLQSAVQVPLPAVLPISTEGCIVNAETWLPLVALFLGTYTR